MKTTIELQKEFNEDYARVIKSKRVHFTSYDRLIKKLNALNEQRKTEGLEELVLPALMSTYKSLM